MYTLERSILESTLQGIVFYINVPDKSEFVGDECKTIGVTVGRGLAPAEKSDMLTNDTFRRGWRPRQP